MPRVYTKTARKDYPEHGIKKGDTYHEWTFYRQRPRKSTTYPKPSQLTNVESESTMLAAYETEQISGPEDVRSIIDQLEEARDLEQEKYDNLYEYFPDGERTYAAEQNVGSLEEAISQLEDIESEWQEALDNEDDEAETRDWATDVLDTQPDWE